MARTNDEHGSSVSPSEREVEAIWAEMRRALADARTRATPDHPKVEAYWRKRIGLALDRVRDARGDDAVSRIVRFLRDDSVPTPPEWLRAADAIEAEFVRSPQSENHEVGIEAAAKWLADADGYPWEVIGTLPKGEAYRERARAVAAAYLSRVSPSPERSNDGRRL